MRAEGRRRVGRRLHRPRGAVPRFAKGDLEVIADRDAAAGGGARHAGQGGELTDRVADHEVSLDAALLQRREHREGGRHERGLLHRGVDELVGVRVEAEALEIETGHCAPSPEDVHCGRDRFREVPAHAGLDRALAREAEGDLVHAGDCAVQRISALPQVRPAPIPVMSTSLPG